MIGALRYQIDLLDRVETPDEAGGRSATWSLSATVWAAVDDLPSIGVVVGGRGRRVRRIRALVRARAGLLIGGRMRHAGLDYDIVSIESDDERGRRVFLIGEEAVE